MTETTEGQPMNYEVVGPSITNEMPTYDPFLIETFAIQIYGDTGTGKSTLALSSKRYKYDMELDVGSLARAAAGLNINRDLVSYKKYQLPPTSLRDRGRVSDYMVGKDGKGATTIVHTLKGWDDLMYRFTNDFADNCEKNPGVVEDIIIDTGNLCWELLQDGTREQIQKAMPRDTWEKELKRLEFEEPNKKLWDMCNYAKACGKNLIFTAKEREQWGGSNYIEGSHMPEGSRDLPGYVDATIRMTVVQKKAQAEIIKSAAGGFQITGFKMLSPTLDDIFKLMADCASINRYLRYCEETSSMVMASATFPAPLTLKGITDAAEMARGLMQ